MTIRTERIHFMKHVLPIVLIICMLLCGCSSQGADTTTTPSTETLPPETTQAAPSTEPPTVPTEETTAPTEVTEAAVLFRNPLNGEPIDSVWTARPYAVMLNNIRAAQPLCSLVNADMMFEFLVEGGITRCIALYSDMTDVPHIGSIRSARPYFVDVASSYNAIYVHHGGSDDGYAAIRNLDVDDIDSNDADFYRDQDRLDAGYSMEHTSFVNGNSLIEASAEMDYTTQFDNGVDYGYQFADQGSTSNGQAASYVDLRFIPEGKQTILHYDSATDAYTLYQHGDDVIDGNTNLVVPFKNALILAADTYTYQKGENIYLDITLTGSGEGYFISGGRAVPIIWSKADQYSPFVFTHEDGTPITFAVGRTYIAVTEDNLYVEFK